MADAHISGVSSACSSQAVVRWGVEKDGGAGVGESGRGFGVKVGMEEEEEEEQERRRGGEERRRRGGEGEDEDEE